MFSDGTSQRFKGLYVIGEALGQERYDLPGVASFFFGQAVLDAFPVEQVAVRANGDHNLLKKSNRQGDWAPNKTCCTAQGKTRIRRPRESQRNDPFMCPIQKLGEGPGKSQSISQINNAEFGVYAHNGVSFRINFELIFDPDAEGKQEEIYEDRRARVAGRKAIPIDAGMRA